MDDEKGSIPTIVKIRITWLLTGLVASLIVSKYIHTFEDVLQKNILVVTFIPLIVYLADAIGTQMESIIIRAISKEKKFDFKKFFYKQMRITIILAAILGMLGFLGSYAIYKDRLVSYGLGISIIISALTSLLTGTIIPYFFWKLHKDPAEASGPVATVIQDTLSIVVYFSVFMLLIK